jgi:hypothetical protein
VLRYWKYNGSTENRFQDQIYLWFLLHLTVSLHIIIYTDNILILYTKNYLVSSLGYQGYTIWYPKMNSGIVMIRPGHCKSRTLPSHCPYTTVFRSETLFTTICATYLLHVFIITYKILIMMLIHTIWVF